MSYAKKSTSPPPLFSSSTLFQSHIRLKFWLRISYYVCEKSDGIRYLLYLTAEPIGPDGELVESPFLIDRKNNFWYIDTKELHFPLRDRPVNEYHIETLIDAELVMEEFPEGKEPRLLVFDCLVLDGQSLMQRTLDKRLAYFKERVLQPQRELLDKYPDEKRFQPFTVHMKSMQFAYGIEMMFSQVLPSLHHGNDGLIFTCTGSPYQFGTDQHILKWKPADENTLDFRWQMEYKKYYPNGDEGSGDWYYDYDGKPVAKLYVLGGSGHGGVNPFTHRATRGKWYQYFDNMYLEDELWEQLKALGDPLDDRIIEGYRDEEGRWRFTRFRDDKNEANHISTVENVLASIKDAVSKQELLEAAPNIKERWKARAEVRKQQAQQAKR